MLECWLHTHTIIKKILYTISVIFIVPEMLPMLVCQFALIYLLFHCKILSIIAIGRCQDPSHAWVIPARLRVFPRALTRRVIFVEKGAAGGSEQADRRVWCHGTGLGDQGGRAYFVSHQLVPLILLGVEISDGLRVLKILVLSVYNPSVRRDCELLVSILLKRNLVLAHFATLGRQVYAHILFGRTQNCLSAELGRKAVSWLELVV